MEKTEITQEQYDAWVEDIRSGKAVHAKGRRAVTIAELDFLVDALDAEPVRETDIEPAYPQLVGLWDAGEIDRVRAENDRLREENTGLADENTSLKADLVTATEPAAKAERLTLKKENAELAAKVETFGKSLTEHAARLSELETENHRLADENEALKAVASAAAIPAVEKKEPEVDEPANASVKPEEAPVPEA